MQPVSGRERTGGAQAPDLPVAKEVKKADSRRKIKRKEGSAPAKPGNNGNPKKLRVLDSKKIQTFPPEVAAVLKKLPEGARVGSIKVKVGNATYKIIVPEASSAKEKTDSAEEKKGKWLGRTVRWLSGTGLVIVAVASTLKQGGIALGLSLPVFQKLLGLTQFTAVGYGLVAVGAIVWGIANIFGRKIELYTPTTLAYSLLSFSPSMLEAPPAPKAEGA